MERKGYVYVLHLDSPLAHARHYVGCTSDPRGRFITHAKGRGSRLIEAALAAGIGFKVAALGVTHVAGMRRIERQLKDWHGASPMCSCCTPDPRAIPGTRSYPLDALTFPVRSDELAMLAGPQTITARLSSADDPPALQIALKELMKTEKDALGFIPAGGPHGLTDLTAAGKIALAFCDGALCGYAAFTWSDTAKIHQCVVRDALRGCGIGRRLVQIVAQAVPGKAIQAKVRDDLSANDFWRAIGFTLAGHETHSTSGSRLNVYCRPPITQSEN